MHSSLGRRLTAEGTGAAVLVAVVVGSGIHAERLSPGDTGLQLLENALATGGGLVALILALGPVSGAHFNPVVTMAERFSGGLPAKDSALYVVAQVLGACVGAAAANVMFELDAIHLSTRSRASVATGFAEVIATFGLVLVIAGVARSAHKRAAPYAVAGYIVSAYWFTSSTSFANPAVTIGRALTDTFAGIEWTSVPAFVSAQVVGAGAAIALARYLYRDVPAELVVPHDDEG